MKKIILSITILTCVALTGCGKGVNITEEQSSMIAEYVASTLLKYDKTYNDDLIEITPSPTPKPTKTPVPTPLATEKVEGDTSSDTTDSTEVKDKKPTYVELSEVLGTKDISVTYNRYSLYDSYPKNSKDVGYSIEAGKDKNLVVVQFKIKNNTSKDKQFDLKLTNTQYLLSVSEKENYQSELTILPNDIHYATNIKANKTKNMLLFFKVPKKTDISDAKLYVASKDKKAKVILK